ncbi:hypothetical protein [Sinorhizobium meliloti]|uniref:hypothetical protein n=1 Tax=Rhizobium meliloti TaxID=382 RepID=UPI0013E37446|nr:hypothetical protein [Sinorhizobium meliloti]
MTTPALVKSADLQRMVAVANSKGVTVLVEFTAGASGFPPIPSTECKKAVAKDENF